MRWNLNLHSLYLGQEQAKCDLVELIYELRRCGRARFILEEDVLTSVGLRTQTSRVVDDCINFYVIIFLYSGFPYCLIKFLTSFKMRLN